MLDQSTRGYIVEELNKFDQNGVNLKNTGINLTPQAEPTFEPTMPNFRQDYVTASQVANTAIEKIEERTVGNIPLDIKDRIGYLSAGATVANEPKPTPDRGDKEPKLEADNSEKLEIVEEQEQQIVAKQEDKGKNETNIWTPERIAEELERVASDAPIGLQTLEEVEDVLAFINLELDQPELDPFSTDPTINLAREGNLARDEHKINFASLATLTNQEREETQQLQASLLDPIQSPNAKLTFNAIVPISIAQIDEIDLAAV
jgi:hypothetical protein